MFLILKTCSNYTHNISGTLSSLMQWMARLTGPVCMYLMQLWMETPCKFQDFLSQCGVILK